jgi:hypothetical protein
MFQFTQIHLHTYFNRYAGSSSTSKERAQRRDEEDATPRAKTGHEEDATPRAKTGHEEDATPRAKTGDVDTHVDPPDSNSRNQSAAGGDVK